MAQAIREFNQYKLADVLIVARGGGSIEDLWAFNEEVVAQAIFESEIPVVNAVGHGQTLPLPISLPMCAQQPLHKPLNW